MNQRWFVDGLIVGVATVAFGISLSTLLPNQGGALLGGSTVGAIASSMLLTKRRNQDLFDLRIQVDDMQAALDENRAELSDTQKELDALMEAADGDRHHPTAALGTGVGDPVGALSVDPSVAIASLPHLPMAIVQGVKHPVVVWFAAKNISIEKHYTSDQDVDEVFNKNAIFLGQKYQDEFGEPLLAPMLQRMKWAISQGRGLQIHLKNATQSQIQAQTQFCHNLHRDSLLSSYHYSKANKVIHAAIQDRGDIRNFFNGNWFERFTCYQIRELLSTLQFDYSYLMNPYIRLPNGDSFELDLFFLVEGKPLLIECKTGGDFNQHLRKFADHCQRFSIPRSQAFLVKLDLEDDRTPRLSKFWSFTVVNQVNFIPTLKAILLTP
jgi:hypothetical protein